MAKLYGGKHDKLRYNLNAVFFLTILILLLHSSLTDMYMFCLLILKLYPLQKQTPSLIFLTVVRT